ncbi:MAG: hypothetical protein V3W51_00720, partial [Candidatus Brocadiales bacterium]
GGWCESLSLQPLPRLFLEACPGGVRRVATMIIREKITAEVLFAGIITQKPLYVPIIGPF